MENLIIKIQDKTLTVWELSEFRKNWKYEDMNVRSIRKIINILKENGYPEDFAYALGEAFFIKWGYKEIE